MNIIVDNTIQDKYHHGFDRDQPITEIVIHGTGGGATAQDLLNWMAGVSRLCERAAEYIKGVGLFHYLIDRGGDIYQLLDLDKWCYHSSSGQHDKYTVGIEHMNPDAANNYGYTDEQYTALEELILKLLNDNPMIATIVGHGQNKKKYSGGYKNCPGPFFEWPRLHAALNAGGYNFVLGVESLRRNV